MLNRISLGPIGHLRQGAPASYYLKLKQDLFHRQVRLKGCQIVSLRDAVRPLAVDADGKHWDAEKKLPILVRLTGDERQGQKLI